MNRQGRVVIPVGMRRALGVNHGGELLASMEGDRLVLSTARDAEQRLFERWARVDYSSSQLIRDRRKEGRREAKK